MSGTWKGAAAALVRIVPGRLIGGALLLYLPPLPRAGRFLPWHPADHRHYNETISRGRCRKKGDIRECLVPAALGVSAGRPERRRP